LSLARRVSGGIQLFNDFESIGDRVGCPDLILLTEKHPVNDPTDRDVVVYH
jgi:hypothetical protein